MPDAARTSAQADGARAPAADSNSSLIPLNAMFADDFVQILVTVTSNQTVAELADAVAHQVEGVRVPSRDLPKVVYHEDRVVPSELTVAEAGIAPLDHVRVEYAA